ncbi:MAG: LysM peptidoglycan-binding domain-containing M23 family metallopeptidase [Candidatus Omnitrophota bacterium]|nr:LysM peptidoglycan-binding domain-containing M23 family metallopeptidase [Candidatus Omnitrophota bacterium]MBU1929103.1 LysM peptidoglycan-binding domain-containing M23 family metallopeptidase [Candidatus Omnitrophota bacterium]MBU1929146.1 LysM peptidoglycan-binding domain-containing M23 family metallopeptidase [Candidatus Omnitrophota bacterium]MBU2035026.1 LysM peptidoglycan-binding domain-containing M23 family metallopeptidase [Candidatus Omnitrophota bacterium]MBU2221834.1 LysM peptido
MEKMRGYLLRNRKRITYILYTTYFMLFLVGCASTTVIKPTHPGAARPEGVYHRVEKGQTLWAISKKYSVDIDSLARANRIFDTARIEVGQLIFIPENKQPAAVKVYSNDDFIWPLEGKVVSSFGQSFNNMINKGLNIQPASSADILVSRSGRVVFYSDNFISFGKTLIVDHQDGFLTVYAGIAQALVKLGDDILKGVSIGRVYPTSNLAGGKPYLHFEIRKGHLAQNPYFYLP